jgi:hypothetical protein
MSYERVMSVMMNACYMIDSLRELINLRQGILLLTDQPGDSNNALRFVSL